MFVKLVYTRTLLALCPPAVPPGNDGSTSGGGGANIAVIGMMAMTSMSMSLICIPESPIQLCSKLYVCMFMKAVHAPLLTVAVITVIVIIVAITIAIAVCTWQRGCWKCKGRHDGYLPFRSYILSAIVCPVYVHYFNSCITVTRGLWCSICNYKET